MRKKMMGSAWVLGLVFSIGLSVGIPSVEAQAREKAPAAKTAGPQSASLPACFKKDEKGVILNPNYGLAGHPYRRVYGFVLTKEGDIYNVYEKGGEASVRAESSNAIRWGDFSEATKPSDMDMLHGEQTRAARMGHFFAVTLQANFKDGCPVAPQAEAEKTAESAPAAKLSYYGQIKQGVAAVPLKESPAAPTK
jgi:hypothetical protein